MKRETKGRDGIKDRVVLAAQKIQREDVTSIERIRLLIVSGFVAEGKGKLSERSRLEGCNVCSECEKTRDQNERA